MGLNDEMITVLWPDGPRLVSAAEIVSAAIDALCNEEDFASDAANDEARREILDRKSEEMSLDEAIEIVNHHGYYTTARREKAENDPPPHDHATATGMYDP
jgi:hypothetical protein